jgi:hypothetical protein
VAVLYHNSRELSRGFEKFFSNFRFNFSFQITRKKPVQTARKHARLLYFLSIKSAVHQQKSKKALFSQGFLFGASNGNRTVCNAQKPIVGYRYFFGVSNFVSIFTENSGKIGL